MTFIRQVARITMVLVAGLLAGGAALAAPPPAPESVAVGSHTVIAPARSLAFVMADGSKGRELVAVELATGKVRWRSTKVHKPIAVRGGDLIALDATGQALVVDVRTGAAAKRCAKLDGVAARFTDSLGARVRVFGSDDGTALYLTSITDTHYAGGMRRSAEEMERARTHTEITWALDLAACRATPARAPAPVAAALDATTELALPGGNIARIVRDPQAGTVTLVPASTNKAAIDLTEGDPRRTNIGLSLDRRHVACAEPAKSGAVFDLATGAATHPPLFDVTSPWIVRGTTLVVGARGVSAYDVTTATARWSFAESDTTYRGPYPPAARR